MSIKGKVDASQKISAIDVVLLPDVQMMEEAIALNHKWDWSHQLPLNLENCLPHITLGMGAVVQASLPNINEQIAEVVSKMKPFVLHVSGIYQLKTPDGRNVFGLDYECGDELIALHEAIMKVLIPFLVPPIPTSIDRVRGLDEITLRTIRQFPQKGSFEKYRPHLTLGFGRLPSLDKITLKSTIEGLFICQLANYCTCARILKSFPFKS